jgi:uncharacterized protein YhbP (UPF0306 family)
LDTLRQLVSEYLASGTLMQVATSNGDQPWVAHVWYSFTEDLGTVVFTSNKDRRHSQEIRANPHVACGVVAVELEGLGQDVRGLTFEGEATEATGADVEFAYELHADRWPGVREGRKGFALEDVVSGATPMRMYMIRVREYVLFDEVNFKDDPRQRLPLGRDR